jgi:DNA-binding FadR family transcriptional regulator
MRQASSVVRIDQSSDDGIGLVAQAVNAVIALIRARDLGPGDTLPSESELARDLDVSRTVVREAYRSLAALHLIELGNGRKARVAELDYRAMSLMIDHGVQTDQISIQQVYDVRRTIELRTVALASLRRTDEEAESILAHASAMANNFDDAPTVMEHDIAFHALIAQASRNPVFSLIVGAFSTVTRQTWAISWRSRPTDAERWLNVNALVTAGIK